MEADKHLINLMKSHSCHVSSVDVYANLHYVSSVNQPLPCSVHVHSDD